MVLGGKKGRKWEGRGPDRGHLLRGQALFVAARTPICPVTNLNKALHLAGHGKLLAVGWPGLLGDCVLRQPPALLHYQLLRGRNKEVPG